MFCLCSIVVQYAILPAAFGNSIKKRKLGENIKYELKIILNTMQNQIKKYMHKTYNEMIPLTKNNKSSFLIFKLKCLQGEYLV